MNLLSWNTERVWQITVDLGPFKMCIGSYAEWAKYLADALADGAATSRHAKGVTVDLVERQTYGLYAPFVGSTDPDLFFAGGATPAKNRALIQERRAARELREKKRGRAEADAWAAYARKCKRLGIPYGDPIPMKGDA